MGKIVKKGKTGKIVKKTGLGLLSKKPGALGKLRVAALRSTTEYREALGLVLDNSASMAMQDASNYSMSRLDAVKRAIGCLLDSSSELTSRIVVTTFSDSSHIVCPLTNRYQMVRETVDKIKVAHGTTLLPALEMTTDVLRLQDVAVRRIIVLSDGEAWDDREVLTWAEKTKAAYRLPIIDTIYFNSTDHGKELMVKLAEISGGRFYYAADAAELAITFKQLDVKTRGLLTDGK